uniref:Uncharacterized protein n=1 Tax=Chromera velia CCMP2878 TaxID=1169474 RepID=A0A0G4GIG4_9ALVE|eukprot:Cvel_22043.t1-p1 / transcript=Cvel_22043.t1 / gene=Cvel_22043 / organism=Chromera_velia_CCMP2878 / gene_product=hypothetical protein / transcript_product=hypothetical protein / location=Cvel_scaffold2128:17075-22848(-) / protein_length=1212 / sequence_SO=supercontig / SO=protein_coding / is_pseudo=false
MIRLEVDQHKQTSCTVSHCTFPLCGTARAFLLAGGDGHASSAPPENGSQEDQQKKQKTGSSSNEQKMETDTEHALCVCLQSAKLTIEVFSEVSRRREWFGLAWLIAFLISKKQCRVTPNSIDFSGIRGVCAEKISLLMDLLPLSIQDITLDSPLMEGPALPLLLRFLKGLQRGGERDGNGTDETKDVAAAATSASGGGGGGSKERRRLKALSFAANSIDRLMAAHVFPLLPGTLEKLSLKGNFLGYLQRVEGLAEWIRSGSASSLRTLILEHTQLSAMGLECLADAIAEKPLVSLEVLGLSKTSLVGQSRTSRLGQKMKAVCRILSAAALPRVREVGLSGCGLGEEEVVLLGGVLEKGELPCLESLDLGGNEGCGSEGGLKALGGALRKSAVPSLKNVDLRCDRWRGAGEGPGVFLDALASPECPPLEKIQMTLNLLEESHAQKLGAGVYAPIRTVRLYLPDRTAAVFFREMANSPNPPKFDSLNLRIVIQNEAEAEHMFSSLASVVQLNRFRCIQRLVFDCYSLPDNGPGQVDFNDEFFGTWTSQGTKDAKLRFFTALADVQLPNLSEMAWHCVHVSEADCVPLAAAFRHGNFPSLRKFVIEGSGSLDEIIGREGMETLMGGLMESEEGLPLLEEFALSISTAGEALASMGPVLSSGKLRNLSTLLVDGGRMTGDALRGFAASLRGRSSQFPPITTLDFSWGAPEDRGAWEEFMAAIAESEVGLRHLKSLGLERTPVAKLGGSVVAALASGKLPGLESLITGALWFDQEGVGALGEAVRAGRLPERLSFATERYRWSWNVPIPPWILRGSGEGGAVAEGPPETVRVEVDGLMASVEASERGLPPVTCLGLSGARLGREGVGSLVRSFGRGNLGGVEGIDLGDTALTDQSLLELGVGVTRGDLCAVTFLNLSENPQVGREGVKALMKAVGESEIGLPKLKCLNLSRTNARGGGVFVARALESGKIPKIQDLLLLDCGFDEECAVALAGALRSQRFPGKVLKGLELGRGVLLSTQHQSTQPPPSFDSLMSSVEQSQGGLPNLERLVIRGGRLGVDGMLSLAASFRLGKLSSLLKLHLCECEVDDWGLKLLTLGLVSTPNLKLCDLTLIGNSITPEGLNSFVDLLSRESLPKLKALDVSAQTGFREGGVPDRSLEFASAVTALKQRLMNERKLRSLDRFHGFFAVPGTESDMDVSPDASSVASDSDSSSDSDSA